MSIAARPLWQQVTALVSLSTGGAITGFSFVPGAVGDLTSPTSMPVRLMALEKAAQPTASSDAMLRSAIVNVANYYLRMAATKTPAEMEQIIWQHDSLDGVDHGPSCAAFASLTLELGAQVVGQQSWVTGGTSYPWPMHTWADVRVDPNSSSLGITSILQDAQANDRWHPLGDGYQHMPGDWVLFDGHVEVVTSYSGGTLYTIGGDSGPNLSVNSHEYPAPLAAQGVVGFVDNGGLPVAASQTPSSPARQAAAPRGPGQAAPGRADSGQAAIPGAPQAGGRSRSAPGARKAGGSKPGSARSAGGDAIPATPVSTPRTSVSPSGPPSAGLQGPPAKPTRPPAPHRAQPPGRVGLDAGTDADVPGTSPLWSATTPTRHAPGAAAIPGLPTAPHGRWARSAAQRSARRGRHQPRASLQSPASAEPPVSAVPPVSPVSDQPPASSQPSTSSQPPASPSSAATPSQRAFINEIVPGAIAAQRKYGVPASVTIAQAIEESGWGQSGLATRDYNLFGIKGTGPAGYDMLPTQEFENGQMVNSTGIFRVYHNYAQSIDDHGRVLATSGYYRQAMANRLDPNTFAASLTGIYATDPQYGAKLIKIMQNYNLYRYDATESGGTTSQPPNGGASIPGVQPGSAPAPSVSPSRPSSPPRPSHHVRPAHHVRHVRTPQPVGSVPGPQPLVPGPTPTPSGPAPTPTPSGPAPTPTSSGSVPTPAPSGSVPTPSPSGSVPTPTTSGSAPAPSGRASTPAPTGLTPAAVPSGLAPTPVPSQLAPAGVPSGMAPTPAPSQLGPAAVPPGLAPTPAPTRPAPTPERSWPAPTPQPVRPSATPGPAPSPSATRGPRTSPAPAERAKKPLQVQLVSDIHLARQASQQTRAGASRAARAPGSHYHHHLPFPVRNAFLAAARGPIMHAKPLYRDVASHHGLRWELLAACDWMQCEARPRYSPVHGEKLGAVNPDGTIYHTKSEALAQCAEDLIDLAGAVYQIDLTAEAFLSVGELANAFAAFRWGALLRLHRTSAMEFPYSVAGLTEQHMNMRWPKIDEPNAPDKPGARFHRPFGAVAVVLGLNYPAIA
jgi:flagellum-specific peptidoglycan hydrolase FlgJ